jgi:succinoglycan biosynthesis protein ExoL
MLGACRDSVVAIGFHRDDNSVAMVAGSAAIDLGRTFDRNFAQRIAMVLRQCWRVSNWADGVRHADVIIARNLEMLVLGALARWRYAPSASLVYEALDIHRLLLSRGIVGRLMRRTERLLLRKADLLIVSSPAFLRDYFESIHQFGRNGPPEVLLVENKLLPAACDASPAPVLAAGPPWRIGWFGMVRCRKSLDALCELATRYPGLVEVTIRGRPSRTEFDDFDAQVARTNGVSFGGAYRPAELERLYRGVHFNWAIDYFEEGANSRWLLPNRIYEGGAYQAVPIALDGTETARWLTRLGIGVVLQSVAELDGFFSGLTPDRYTHLKAASCAAPRTSFVADDRDSARLLDALRRARTRRARGPSGASALELDLRNAGEPRDDSAM